MATQVYIGDDISNPLFSFDDDTIISLTTHVAVNLMPQELTADTADITVVYDGNDAIQEIDWATPVLIYSDAQLIGKFYLTNVKRVGATRYELSATSIIGLLEHETFYGQKFYNVSLQNMLRDILLTNGFKYCRFYNTVHRGLFDGTDASTTLDTFRPIRIQTGISRYPMNSKVEVHFKLNRCILNELVQAGYQYVTHLNNSTEHRLPLWGNGIMSDLGEVTSEELAAIKSTCYGVYMDVVRETVNDDWPEYGEVFFIYENDTFSLGTPTAPTDYEISVNPSEGTAIINGTTYNITNNHPDTMIYPLASCCGGMLAGLWPDDRSVTSYMRAICCDIEYGKYKLWNSDGTKLVDLIYTEDPYNRKPQSNNMPAQWASAYIDFAKLDRESIAYDGGADDWAYNCYNSISYGGGVDNIKVYGWIPVCTKREALHQLLLATGVIMKKDDDGNIIFTSPVTTDAISLSSDKIYADGSQEQLEYTNRIEVTEHIFEADDSSKRETIFENTNQRSGVYVALYQKQPCDSSVFSNLSVLSYNANAAIVMGTGTITGIPTKHIETVLHRDIGNRKDGRTISINDDTLVTLPNSETVLDRLEAYYGSAYEVNNDIVLGDEKTGNLYSFTSPFRDQVTGYLSKISSTFSRVTKAACQFICGYNPPEIGQDFTRFVILTGSGTWTVPESVFEKDNPRIRVVLIGGGQGGSSGYAGADGESARLGPAASTPAAGGATGEAGTGGKVFSVDISNPSASFSFSCGEGGQGGEINYSHDESNSGGSGGDTTFSDGTISYSSASGESSTDGITNFFNGAKYAKQVIYFADGGAGGYWADDGAEKKPEDVRLGLVKGEYAWYNNAYWYNYGGKRGDTVGGSKIAYGGAGGGAALTNEPGTISGGNGADAIRNGTYYRAGDGGAGANATFTPIPALSINSAYYGYGGQGGAGGGGGGSSGTGSPSVIEGTGGKGGYGGVGGKGGNGCVLIYY